MLMWQGVLTHVDSSLILKVHSDKFLHKQTCKLTNMV